MLVTYFVNFRWLNDHLFGKELFIQFTASAFRKLPSIYVFSYFPFGFEGRMWDLIVSVPDHCLFVLLFNLKTAINYCLQHFTSENILKNHTEVCLKINGAQKVKMPQKDTNNNNIFFPSYHKQLTAQFVIYADV